MPPLTIMIKPASSACTMRCRYCFYADVAENRQVYSHGQMSLNTLDTIVRRAMSYADGYISFSFQGGEPTLAGIDFYKELIRLEKRYNSRKLPVHHAIQTNGYKLDDDLLQFLVDNNFLIGVSLDGTADIHDKLRLGADGKGSFAHVTKTISRLQELGAQFNILTVVNSYVARHGAECFRALAQYGYLQFIPCLDPFDGQHFDYSLNAADYGHFLKETFDLYYAAFNTNKPVSIRNFDNYIGILLGQPPETCGMCGRCGGYYLIEADGGVYPCDFYVLDQWQMGNINDSSFFRLEKSPLAQAFRDISVPLDKKCSQCPWFSLCRGGCRRDREPFTGDIPSLNQWCESYQAFFEYAFPRMREIAETLKDRMP